MKVTINGREYEDYQLSNEDLYYLVSGKKYTYTLSEEEKKVLTDKLIDRFKHECCAREGEGKDELFANQFSNYVNRCPNDFEKAAEAMGRDHRYLQSEMFKMCLAYIKVLNDHYINGRYDARNEWACGKAHDLLNSV